MITTRHIFDGCDLPRLGWSSSVSPVSELADMAAEIGVAWLGVKRDDLLSVGSGGSKVRKLDYVLAAEPWASAPGFATSGAIGSGHLVACVQAAQRLGRTVDATLFWQPPSDDVLANLAFTAAGADRLNYRRSRLGVAMRSPGLLLGGRSTRGPVVPPGASNAIGTLGMVRAGLELADQVRAGEIPRPDRLYVALGSGGSAVGLAIGLHLAGLETEVVAVAVVERLLSTSWRIAALARATCRVLATAGFNANADSLRLLIDRGHLGRGYGTPTDTSLKMRTRVSPAGIELDGVYTGKAMGALLADAAAGFSGNVVFWQTRRGPLPPPTAAWRERLPPRLRADLERHETGADARRRRFLVATSGAAVAATLGWRLSGYEPVDVSLTYLATTEAAILAAIAECVVPAATSAAIEACVTAIDRYLGHLPTSERRLCRAATWLVDQASSVSGSWRRLSRLPIARRREVFATMVQRLDKLGEASRGVRDLVMLGHYQRPATWKALGYNPAPAPSLRIAPRYAALFVRRANAGGSSR